MRKRIDAPYCSADDYQMALEFVAFGTLYFPELGMMLGELEDQVVKARKDDASGRALKIVEAIRAKAR